MNKLVRHVGSIVIALLCIACPVVATIGWTAVTYPFLTIISTVGSIAEFIVIYFHIYNMADSEYYDEGDPT